MSTVLAREIPLGERKLDIRRLDPTNDQWLFRASYNWLVNSPTWRRHAEEVFGTLDAGEYMAASLDERRIDIGVWANDTYTAKVALHLTAKHTYEVSLEAARWTDPTTIIQAGQAIRDQLFGNYSAQLVYAWVPRWARGAKAILTSIGFLPDNVIMARGTARGRLIEWDRYSLRRSNEQQEQATDHPDAEPVL